MPWARPEVVALQKLAHEHFETGAVFKKAAMTGVE
jgi:hypothetical protein